MIITITLGERKIYGFEVFCTIHHKTLNISVFSWSTEAWEKLKDSSQYLILCAFYENKIKYIKVIIGVVWKGKENRQAETIVGVTDRKG